MAHSVLAVGAHLKNTVALSVGPQVFISQHIGDLETDQSFEAFRRVIADFQSLYESRPALIAADAHPDYLSTKFAHDLASRSSRRKEAPTSALNPQPSTLNSSPSSTTSPTCSPAWPRTSLSLPLLGVSWDGTGYGLDGTVWGGEFFLVTETACERVAHLRPFRLARRRRGGKGAAPHRPGSALRNVRRGGLRHDRPAPLQAFSPAELGPLKTMLARRLNSPLTSSVGRLFDAVASLVGLRQQVRFEGQAAMELEFALEGAEPTSEAYEFPIRPDHASRTTHHAPLLLDWSPMIEAILSDLTHRVPLPLISARFHNALAEAIVAVAKRVGQPRVVLSGGCFQNRYLTERTVQRLQEEGFRPYWHQRIPPNDGGIALGQVVAAFARVSSVASA